MLVKKKERKNLLYDTSQILGHSWHLHFLALVWKVLKSEFPHLLAERGLREHLTQAPNFLQGRQMGPREINRCTPKSCHKFRKKIRSLDRVYLLHFVPDQGTLPGVG